LRRWFDRPPPDAADLSRRWSGAVDTAQALLANLPAVHTGKTVFTNEGELSRGQAGDLDRGLAAGDVVFHAGRRGGALPQLRV